MKSVVEQAAELARFFIIRATKERACILNKKKKKILLSPPIINYSQVNSLYVVVGSLLLGAVVLVVGLVQLAPGAEAAQNSAALIATGSGLLVIGVFLAPLRAVCIRKQSAAQKDGTHQRSVTSIDMLLAQHR